MAARSPLDPVSRNRVSDWHFFRGKRVSEIDAGTKEKGFDYGDYGDHGVQAKREFLEFCDLVCLVLPFDRLNLYQLDKFREGFYRTLKPGVSRALRKHPEEFLVHIEREFRRGDFGEAENFDVEVFFRSITVLKCFMGLDKMQKTGLRPNVGAALSRSPARGHSSAQGSLVDVGEEVKENFSPDLVIRDPTSLKTLSLVNVGLSTVMISKYTSGSLPAEILQSLAISSATVGVLATGTALYLIISQRRSLPFGFECEVSIQTLENVGFSATGIAFIVGMLLLLPNNLSRFIVGGVLCAVFLIIIFAKLRPKREAKTELVSSQRPTDLASNLLPPDSGTELADLSQWRTMSSPGENCYEKDLIGEQSTSNNPIKVAVADLASNLLPSDFEIELADV